jgi:polyphosphate kinase 2 (PPK2 family)
MWQHRFEDIRNVEQYLSRNGVLIRKFFLHVSKKEQKKRFLERLEKPEKNWKFNPEDLKERERWDAYQAAYEKTIRATATKHAPWYVVPADHKWFTRLVVASAIIEGLAGLDLRFPEVTSAQKREIARARRLLGDR